MKKYIFLLILVVFFAACITDSDYIDDGDNIDPHITETINETNTLVTTEPIVEEPVIKETKANFSAINHSMHIDNPLWEGPIKYHLSYEDNIKPHRLNITLNAVNEAIEELENLANIQFEQVSDLGEAGLIVEINRSLKHLNPSALGIARVTDYQPRQIDVKGIDSSVNYNAIKNARIFLTPIYPCAAKIEAMHEILHILGLAHSTETNSIMYKFGAVCTSQITPPIKTTLQALYPE